MSKSIKALTILIKNKGCNFTFFILKFFCILILLMPLAQLKAQCFMTGTKANVNQIVILDELMSLSINCQKDIKCYIEMSIFNSKNVLLVQCKTQEFKIPTNGVFMVNSGNVQMLKPYTITPVVLNETTSIIKSQEILPEGKYYLKYKLIGKGPEDELILITDYQEEINVMLNTPPFILTPNCGKSTKIGKQFYSWTPAFSIAGDRTFTYNIHFMEILEKQTKETAVRSNTPVLSVRNLMENSYQLDAYEEQLLSVGECYAWYVEVVSDDAVLQRSDICEFCNLLEKPEKVPARPYIDIRKSSTSKIFPVVDGKVYFMYTEDYAVTENEVLQLKLFSDERKKELKIDMEPFPVKTGKNYYYFDVCKDRDLRPGLYILEIKNTKGQTYRVKFNKPKEYRCE